MQIEMRPSVGVATYRARLSHQTLHGNRGCCFRMTQFSDSPISSLLLCLARAVIRRDDSENRRKSSRTGPSDERELLQIMRWWCFILCTRQLVMVITHSEDGGFRHLMIEPVSGRKIRLK